MNFSRPSTHEQTVAKEYPMLQPIYYVNWGTAVVVLAMLLLTATIIYITSQNAESAPFGIVGSVIFFLIGMPMGVLAVNGSIKEMWKVSQEQATIRQRDRMDVQLQMYYQQPALRVEHPLQLSRNPAADPAPQHQGRRFVAPVPTIAESTKIDAANFITQLFNPENGRPLPSKITKNKYQIQHPSPTPEAVEYLTALDILSAPEGKQLYYNILRYPTYHDAYDAIRTGRKASYKEGMEMGKEEGSHE